MRVDGTQWLANQGKEGGAGGGCGGSVEKRARAGDEEADDIDKNAGCGRQKNNSVRVFGVNWALRLCSRSRAPKSRTASMIPWGGVMSPVEARSSAWGGGEMLPLVIDNCESAVRYAESMLWRECCRKSDLPVIEWVSYIRVISPVKCTVFDREMIKFIMKYASTKTEGRCHVDNNPASKKSF